MRRRNAPKCTFWALCQRIEVFTALRISSPQPSDLVEFVAVAFKKTGKDEVAEARKCSNLRSSKLCSLSTFPAFGLAETSRSIESTAATAASFPVSNIRSLAKKGI
jgi:hypothetical protein